MMDFFSLLQNLDPSVLPDQCKIHLANWNGREDPLDEYLAGTFDAWQAEQNQKNFERPLVVSLIALPQAKHWLFVGVYDSNGCVPIGKGPPWRYDLRRRAVTSELDGRLIVCFERPGRNSYLLADQWAQRIGVAEIRAERIQTSIPTKSTRRL